MSLGRDAKFTIDAQAYRFEGSRRMPHDLLVPPEPDEPQDPTDDDPDDDVELEDAA
jgi:hypothetical protein